MKGIAWSATASVLWGVSGNLMQFVSQNETVPTIWFMPVRTFFAGIILLLIGFCQVRKHIFDLFKNRYSIIRLLIYSILGIGMNMSTFYICIQTGNAAMATILQYLAPLFIVLFSFLFKGQKPLSDDALVFGVALIGVFLAVTKGDFHQLSIPWISIIFGLLSAISAGIYYSVPQPFMKHNSPFVVLGWGTLISSVFFNLYHPLWRVPSSVHLNHLSLYLGIGGIILIGTVFAFSAMLYSLKFASSEISSIVDAVEPVATFVISIFAFRLPINPVEVMGSILVLFSVYLLQRFHKKNAVQDAKNK